MRIARQPLRLFHKSAVAFTAFQLTSRTMATPGTCDVGSGASPKRVEKSNAEWRVDLTPEQYHILREKGTEPPGSGEYNKFYPEDGSFVCAGCGAVLYAAKSKFDSRCGWPAFDQGEAGAIHINKDTSHGMIREEITCAVCDGHLGHVFRGEGFTPTNERHCVNSVSVKYINTSESKM
eukprot:NODE_5161_length_720_cov_32.777403_g5138_i0.p1 GENE.NODE_5161_length_720_cov_32.777403_g5138_i0~~NODE_5161_length_720_cov_32.777403_g5138_i0.p1  ORF type:complete len:178 (-),score=25.33 NODE_5161_length_720_cov_32.777403_g5138_i0:59-592(-)